MRIWISIMNESETAVRMTGVCYCTCDWSLTLYSLKIIRLFITSQHLQYDAQVILRRKETHTVWSRVNDDRILICLWSNSLRFLAVSQMSFTPFISLEPPLQFQKSNVESKISIWTQTKHLQDLLCHPHSFYTIYVRTKNVLKSIHLCLLLLLGETFETCQ